MSRIGASFALLAAAWAFSPSGALTAAGTGSIPAPAELLFESRENSRQAQRLWNRLLEEPADLWALLELAKVYITEEYPSQAAVLLESTLSLHPGSVEARLLLAHALQAGSEPRPGWARELLEESVRLEPSNPEAHLALGYALQAAGDEDAGAAAFDKVLELTDDVALLVSAHLGAAGSRERMGQVDLGRSHLEAARELYPGIDEALDRAEGTSLLPKPIYGGTIEGDGIHESPDKRARRILKRIEELREDEDAEDGRP